MIESTKLHATLKVTLHRAFTLNPQLPYQSPAALNNRPTHTHSSSATLAVDRLDHLLTTVRGLHPHRLDLTRTTKMTLRRGDRAWQLAAPAVRHPERAQALRTLLNDKARCFGAIREAYTQGEAELAWSLTEALTGLARITNLGQEWPAVLQLGITAATACDHTRGAAALHIASAWDYLLDHPHDTEGISAIQHHSETALALARDCHDRAGQAAAFDVLAHHAHLRGAHRTSARHHGRAIARDARGGDLHGLAQHVLHRARLHLARRRFVEAADDAALAAGVGEVLNEDFLTAAAWLAYTEAQWYLGDPHQDGAQAAGRALRILTPLPATRHLAPAHAWSALGHGHNENPAAREECAAEARLATLDGSPQRAQIEHILTLTSPSATETSYRRPARCSWRRPPGQRTTFGHPQGELGTLLEDADADMVYTLLNRLPALPRPPRRERGRTPT
ncbi:hypothetical protein M8C13_07080 [Crossiella sp. SN42]|uniref:hypothetical protein n=1 Tax=Crossiella sp. SN42 TaxID=2944808 RepID=UPI00207CA326|nr:hypothetical protein [Crossiella sp. SN42]MCO1575520.1 hypothetical protein [Crossiella sp. SN42]